MTIAERWWRRFGQPMPSDIACLPAHLQEKALRITQENTLVFVPREPVTMQREESIADWDRDEKISDPHSAGEFS